MPRGIKKKITEESPKPAVKKEKEEVKKSRFFLVKQDNKTLKISVENIEEFKIPLKIYGNDKDFVTRCINTFKRTNKNVGVLLNGQKGSGKTLTAKMICLYSQLPVYIVTQPFIGDSFYSFLSNIKEQSVIFVDEFEKVYNTQESQEQLLPILDGVFDGKFLFVFTSNTFEVSPYLKNRPSRIRYWKEYEGLEEDTINEIIDDLLIDQSKKEELLYVLKIYFNISIDVLMAIIYEMNLYNQSAREAIKLLNVQLEHNFFDVRMYINYKLHYAKVNFNPLTTNHFYINYEYTDEMGRKRYDYYTNSTKNMTLEIVGEEFRFRDDKNNELIFIPIKRNNILQINNIL